jgi:DNA-binding NtrC family response regulator
MDYMLPDGNALEFLPKLKATDANLPVIILTGHASIDLAVQAVKEGAEHFLTKPVELAALLVILRRAIENQRNRKAVSHGKSQRQRRSIDPFLGVSPAIKRLGEQARRVAAAESPVLLLGETGSGKSVLARWLHESSPRADETFVDINCAGLSRELLDTELFGHERGAFTGATSAKQGLFEVAHRGSIFLDEIGDVDQTVQPKLLKVVEEKKFRRLGEVRDRTVDVRLIAATSHNMNILVREKLFRSDLYFRINTITLTMPPLRERAEDIPILADQLLGKLSADAGRGVIDLSPEATKALKSHSWQGNIRELRNVLERAVLLSDRTTLTPHDLSFDSSYSDAPADGTITNLTLEQLERLHIERVLGEEGGHVEEAAKRLGIPRSSLYQKVKRFGIVSSKP